MDRESILTSVAKTGRLVIVDEDYKSFGLSGEVVATITDVDPRMLKAPVQRVCYPDVPVPYSRVLEYEALPTRDKIQAAIEAVMKG